MEVESNDANPLCDECYAKQEDWQEKNKTAEGMPEELCCEACKNMLKRHCWCCSTTYETEEAAGLDDYTCKKCRA